MKCWNCGGEDLRGIKDYQYYDDDPKRDVLECQDCCSVQTEDLLFKRKIISINKETGLDLGGNNPVWRPNPTKTEGEVKSS